MLDFAQFPSPKRSGTVIVQLTNRKFALKEEGLVVLLAVKNWGFCDTSMTHTNKLRLNRSTTRIIAYHAGYNRPFGHTQIMKWHTDIKNLIQAVNTSVDIFLEEYGGR